MVRRREYAVDGCTVVSASPTEVTLETDGVRTTYDVSVPGHDRMTSTSTARAATPG